MVDEASEDEVIRERAFRISDKLDIGDIAVSLKFQQLLTKAGPAIHVYHYSFTGKKQPDR